VTGLASITALAAGSEYSLALRSDGTIWAWGANYLGQLGDGTTTTRSTSMQVIGLTGVTTLATGSGHSLAFRSGSGTWAWGANNNDQLGDGRGRQHSVPVQTVFP
jgi:alpha-tubulin suppressor-like RCC1 family protein